tara:strand:+ start:396 stop:746 length:351 start_codon:yes stop_codon:yes gene_type:complete
MIEHKFGARWSGRDIDRLKELWVTDKTIAQIGDLMNRTPTSIQSYLKKNREALQLKKRPRGGALRRKRTTVLFDKDWNGAVPFGHWSIIKPWGWSESFREALQDANRRGVMVRYKG